MDWVCCITLVTTGGWLLRCCKGPQKKSEHSQQEIFMITSEVGNMPHDIPCDSWEVLVPETHEFVEHNNPV